MYPTLFPVDLRPVPNAILPNLVASALVALFPPLVLQSVSGEPDPAAAFFLLLAFGGLPAGGRSGTAGVAMAACALLRPATITAGGHRPRGRPRARANACLEPSPSGR